LQADESVLTGESLPVTKTTDVLGAGAPLAERSNMLFKGTALTRGSGEAVVTGTGMETELGKISSLVQATEEEATPLEKRLDQLGHRLIWVCLGVAGLVSVSGIVAGRDVFLMVETGIALAVASIPEGLPIVATIAMARGVWRMARRNALIKQLSAVETLGATTVICTDKTGTLTENRLAAVALALQDQYLTISQNSENSEKSITTENDRTVSPAENLPLQHALDVCVLCNNAALPVSEDKKKQKTVGDPLEVALLSLGANFGLTRENMNANFPEEREEAFDSETKMMATYHRQESGYRVAVKGAPESILDGCSTILSPAGKQELSEEDRTKWLNKNDEMAAAGLRVLALAEKEADNLDATPYTNLVFLGLIGLIDPPRDDVRQVLQECREAGVRVIMATGDQPVTAQAIGYAVGLVDDSQAPVLHGSDLKVAREASDMILKDDAFASIVHAVEQGRIIYKNIKSFVVYLLSCNTSEIMIVGLAAFANAPLPLLPLQILYLNLVTDVFPALALAAGEGSSDIMRMPPRKKGAPIMNKGRWFVVGAYGLTITIAVLSAMAIGMLYFGMDENQAVTVSFLTLAFAQLWHVFNMRERNSRFLDNSVVRNPFIWGALALCSMLLAATVYMPVLAEVLKVSDPGMNGWLLIIGMSLLPLLIGQLVLFFMKSRRR
jgi:Ca2+-transporting ATPase